METTITLELISATLQPLKDLEHELKAIHGMKVFFVEPREATAPVLISLSIGKKDEQAEIRIRRIAHTLYNFLHGNGQEASPIQATLVTIEGESVDIASLEEDEIRQIITDAYTGQEE